MKNRLLVCLSVVVTSSVAASAQYKREVDALGAFDNSSNITGKIVCHAGTTLGKLYVEVHALSGGDALGQKVPVSTTGYFYFNGNPGQTYSVRVTDLTGNVIVEEVLSSSPMGTLEIELPDLGAVQATAATVSLFELQHKVPSKALKEGQKADQCYHKHDMKVMSSMPRRRLRLTRIG